LVHGKTQGWIDWNDYDIFMSARKLQYDAVITLDEDFNKLLLQHGTPPKVIWLKTGNCSTAKLVNVIVSHEEAILNFLLDDAFDCLELYG
jgi:predicted nuclease of predicted toxin-antitoxin system